MFHLYKETLKPFAVLMESRRALREESNPLPGKKQTCNKVT